MTYDSFPVFYIPSIWVASTTTVRRFFCSVTTKMPHVVWSIYYRIRINVDWLSAKDFEDTMEQAPCNRGSKETHDHSIAGDRPVQHTCIVNLHRGISINSFTRVTVYLHSWREKCTEEHFLPDKNPVSNYPFLLVSGTRYFTISYVNSKYFYLHQCVRLQSITYSK